MTVINYNVPMSHIVWKNKELVSLYTLAKEFKEINPESLRTFYSLYNGSKKLSGSSLVVNDIVYAWSAVNAGNMDQFSTKQTETLLELYNIMVSFFKRMGNTSDIIAHNTFDRMVKENYNILTKGLTSEQRERVENQLELVASLRKYFDAQRYDEANVMKFELTSQEMKLFAHITSPLDLFDNMVVTKYVPFAAYGSKFFKY